MSTPAIVMMVVAAALLGGGLLASIASAVLAERRGRSSATSPTVALEVDEPDDGSGTGAGGRAGPRDGSTGPAWPGTVPPVQPDRTTGPSPAAADVAADGVYDRAELQAFAVARLPQIPEAAIHDVFDLLDEHLMVKGIAEVPPGHRWRFYDPDDPRVAPDLMVDTEAVAADAQRLLRIDAATVDRILDVEHAYLEAKGLLG